MKQRNFVSWPALAIALLAASLYAPHVLAQVSIPRLNFQEQKLANGMRILSAVDHANPTVVIQVWYHVGSKDDPAGRSGFAHLFEHMMFKGNQHMTPDMFDNLTENIGGENNAYTADDVTVYHET